MVYVLGGCLGVAVTVGVLLLSGLESWGWCWCWSSFRDVCMVVVEDSSSGCSCEMFSSSWIAVSLL